MSSVYDFKANTRDGGDAPLSVYDGKVLLIINTASKCGFTPQFAGLQALYEKYRDQGLEVLGFPCNQFGHQDPGTDAEIAEFCQLNYDVTFPMFSKIEVNGSGTHALYEHLKKTAPGVLGSHRIKWNFTKFLVNHDGQVVKRFAPQTKPEDIEQEIEALL